MQNKKYQIMKRLYTFIILTCNIFTHNVNAQDSMFCRNIIHNLSSPLMHGRGCAYKGDSIAADFIKQKCIEIDLKSLSNDFYQHYTYPAYAMESECNITVNNQTLVAGKEYLICNFSSSIVQNDIPILYTTTKTVAIPDSLNKFIANHKNIISNCIIYIQNIDSPTKEEEKCLRSFKKINPFGSIGIIIGQKTLPMVSVSNYPEDYNSALIYVIDTLFNNKPSKISISFSNQLVDHNTQNVCAFVEGSEVKDSFIVFTAHYDHVGRMGKDVYFPGAHDNASGVAAVLDIAKYFQQNKPKYSIAFLFFSGEEAGIIGSSIFVENPLIPLDRIKLLVNLDMFCGGDEGIMVVNSQDKHTKIFYNKMLAINNANHYVSNIKSRPNAANSDHYPFSQHCPAIFIYTMGGKYGGYHDMYDNCEKCGLENYENIISLIVKSVVE